MAVMTTYKGRALGLADGGLTLKKLSDEIVNSFTLTPFDDSFDKVVLAPSASQSIKKYTGKGNSFVVVKGDGDSDVDIFYQKDSNPPVLLTASNQDAIISISFLTSLEITVTNNNISLSKSSSTTSSTGSYQ